MKRNAEDNKAKSEVIKAIYDALVANGFEGTFDFAVAVNAPHIPILFYFLDTQMPKGDQEAVLSLVTSTAALFAYEVYDDGEKGYHLKKNSTINSKLKTLKHYIQQRVGRMLHPFSFLSIKNGM